MDNYTKELDSIRNNMSLLFDESQDNETTVVTSEEMLYFRFDIETKTWMLYVSHLDSKIILASVTKTAISLSPHCKKFREYVKIADSMQSFLRMEKE